jgi:hypothetical protein
MRALPASPPFISLTKKNCHSERSEESVGHKTLPSLHQLTKNEAVQLLRVYSYQ